MNPDRKRVRSMKSLWYDQEENDQQASVTLRQPVPLLFGWRGERKSGQPLPALSSTTRKLTKISLFSKFSLQNSTMSRSNAFRQLHRATSKLARTPPLSSLRPSPPSLPSLTLRQALGLPPLPTQRSISTLLRQSRKEVSPRLVVGGIYATLGDGAALLGAEEALEAVFLDAADDDDGR